MNRRGHFALDFPWWFWALLFVFLWPLWACDALGLNLGAYWWTPVTIWWVAALAGLVRWAWKK